MKKGDVVVVLPIDSVVEDFGTRAVGEVGLVMSRGLENSRYEVQLMWYDPAAEAVMDGGWFDLDELEVIGTL